MKHNMNRVLSVVALLMLTIGAWAAQAQEVTIVKNPTNGGTVTSSVTEGVCTLTVTPEAGYYLKSLTAVTTLNGGAMQAPQRRLQIKEGEPLEITPTAANADSAAVTTYTLTMPAADYNVEVTATFQRGYVIVNGKAVTNVNKQELFGDKISFDDETNTLTLKGINFTNTEGWAFEFGDNVTDITVMLEGTNTIAGNGFSFDENPAALTFKTSKADPGSLTVNGASFAPEFVTLNMENGLTYNNKKVAIEEYGLTVGGVVVTGYNADDILSNGKVSYNVEKNILTLNGAIIDMTQTNGYPVQSDGDLKVLLIGKNTLKTNANNKKGFFTTTASATLTFEQQENPDKNGYGRLTVEGVTAADDIAAGFTMGNDFPDNATGWAKSYADNKATLTYVEFYDLKIGGTAITSETQKFVDEADSKVIYYPTSNTLYLNNYTTDKAITTSMARLTIVLTGVNQVASITTTASTDTLFVQNDVAGLAILNKLTTKVQGFKVVSVAEPLKFVQPVTAPTNWSTTTDVVISDATVYGLMVNGVQVTSENMETIDTGITTEGTEGTISFDGENTLTLNSVKLTTGNVPFITNNLNELNIYLVGENKVTLGDLFLTSGSNTDHQVNFTTNVNGAGSLVITPNGDWYAGHSVPKFYNGLAFGDVTEGNVRTLTIAAPEETYNLKIADIEVTNLNAENVLGDNKVSFDATQNTLTLDGATIDGDIESGREELIVYIAGTNTLTGGFVATGSGSHKLVFGCEDTDTLTMGSDIPNDFEAVYNNLLKKTKVEEDGKYMIALPSDFGLMVDGMPITPKNRKNVFEDDVDDEDEASVKFDGYSKLILNNASVKSLTMGNMELPLADDKEAQTQKKTLTIYLENLKKDADACNVIDIRQTGKIVTFTGDADKKGNYQIEIKTSEEAPGSMKVIFSLLKLATLGIGPNSSVDDVIETVFDGIALKYSDSFEFSVDPLNMTITLAQKLTPIVPGAKGDDPVGDNGDKDIDFKNLAELGTVKLKNRVVNNILFVTNDNHEKFAEDDGWDTTGECLALNSKMKKKDLKKALKCTPGTEKFAKYFKGIVFKVKRGIGYVQLKDVKGDAHTWLCIQVGKKGKLRKYELSDEPQNVRYRYHVSKTQYVYIFLMNRSSFDLAPEMALHRIGPKSNIAGQLGGVKVSSSSMVDVKPSAVSHKMMEVSALASSLESFASNIQKGFVCEDEDITTLPDNLFVDNSVSLASRRAGNIAGTILPKGVTFVDFSKTKITDMEVNRTSGPFNGVPDNVFIYLPAGNTVADNTPNVVIGGVCDDMELDGSEDTEPFKVKNDFEAGQVMLKRKFTLGADADARATIYLPCDVSWEDANELGTFYKFVKFDGSTVEMATVKEADGGLKANTPYIFQPKASSYIFEKDEDENGNSIDQYPVVTLTNVKANPEETEGFKGVFERKDYESNMYCYAAEERSGAKIGEFVEMGPGSYVPPFRAYFVGNGSGAPKYSIAWDGVIETADENVTAVEAVKTVAEKKVADGWWTLNGVRMNSKPTKAGMYIMNGKLVVVK